MKNYQNTSNLWVENSTCWSQSILIKYLRLICKTKDITKQATLIQQKRTWQQPM